MRPQLEELTDRLKRLYADMENLRERTARQTENAQKFAIQVRAARRIMPHHSLPPSSRGVGAR